MSSAIPRTLEARDSAISNRYRGAGTEELVYNIPYPVQCNHTGNIHLKSAYFTIASCYFSMHTTTHAREAFGHGVSDVR